MIDEVIFIYNNLEDRDTVDAIPTSRPIALEFLDYGSKLCKKKAYTLMEEWGATWKSLPFAILKENNKVVKCLYSDAGNRVIKDLKEYL